MDVRGKRHIEQAPDIFYMNVIPIKKKWTQKIYISTSLLLVTSYKSRAKYRKFRERGNVSNNENPPCSRVTRIIKNSKSIKFNVRQHRSVHLKISKVKRRRYKKKFKGATQSYHTVILDEILKPLESHELTMVILHELHIYIYIHSHLEGKKSLTPTQKSLHFNK